MAELECTGERDRENEVVGACGFIRDTCSHTECNYSTIIYTDLFELRYFLIAYWGTLRARLTDNLTCGV